MPGSDDQYDEVHTFSNDHAGKSKTQRPAVRELGRDGAPVQLYVGQDVDGAALRTPPANTRFLFFDLQGNLKVKNPDGTIDNISGGAPTDASYVTTAAESGLSNETVANTLTDVYGSPVDIGAVDLRDDATDGNIIWDESAGHVPAAVIDAAIARDSELFTDEQAQDAVGTILAEPLDYDDAAPSIDVSLSAALQVDANNNLDVVDEAIQDIAGALAGTNLTYDDAGNAINVDQGEGSGLNADSWEGYDLQKNGTDGSGVINFKT